MMNKEEWFDLIGRLFFTVAIGVVVVVLLTQVDKCELRTGDYVQGEPRELDDGEHGLYIGWGTGERDDSPTTQPKGEK